LRPAAYGPLVELLFALRNISIDYNPLVPFLTYEPLYVKKAISGKAHADKLMVSTAIHNNQEIVDALCNDIHKLSEHAMDAIAVGWTHLKRLREVYKNEDT
jgi:Holliday junction resolvasome RuvABC endonuclease subunit